MEVRDGLIVLPKVYTNVILPKEKDKQNEHYKRVRKVFQISKTSKSFVHTKRTWLYNFKLLLILSSTKQQSVKRCLLITHQITAKQKKSPSP